MRYGDTRVSASLGVRDALDKEDCIALFPFQIYFYSWYMHYSE